MTDMPHGDDRFLADLDKLIDVPDYHDDFRAEVFAGTLTVVRGRRRRRKILRCAVVALVYVGGLASGVFLNNGDDGRQSLVLMEDKEDVTVDLPSNASSSVLGLDEDPWVLRQQVATALPKERILLLRRAGDVYLLNLGDIEQALHCYQQVLELSSPKEWAQFDPTDSWLLADLKQSMTPKRRGSS